MRIYKCGKIYSIKPWPNGKSKVIDIIDSNEKSRKTFLKNIKSPMWFYWFALNVDRKPKNDTRKGVLGSPMWSYYYFRYVDKKPRRDTRDACVLGSWSWGYEYMKLAKEGEGKMKAIKGKPYPETKAFNRWLTGAPGIGKSAIVERVSKDLGFDVKTVRLRGMGRSKRFLKFKGIDLPEGAKVIHFWPYAYCVAKPAPHCAVFVTPPQYNRLDDELYTASQLVQGDSAASVKAGDWMSIIYCDFKGQGSWSIVVPLQPNVCKKF